MKVQRPTWRAVLVAAAYIVLFLLLTRYSALFEAAPAVMLWYAPAGLNVALLLAGGLGYAPVVFVAGLLGGLLILLPGAPLASLILVAATTALVESAAVALLLRIVGAGAGGEWRRWGLREVVWFALLALVAPVWTAVAGVVNYAAFGIIPWAGVLADIGSWWLGDAIGILTVVPAVLFGVLPLLRQAREDRDAPPWPNERQRLEMAALALSVAAVLWLGFVSPLSASFALCYLCFLPLIWAALRYGLAGASLCTLALSLGATLLIHDVESALEVANLQLFMVVLASSGLLVGALIDDRRRALCEKEVLLQEVHHRVKNNLAVVSSLLSLQAETIADERARAALRDSQDRVRSIARVHEALYRSESLAWVNMGDYVEGMVQHLRESYAAYHVGFDVQAAGVALDIDRAVPCGMVINELVSNALKHAFPPESLGAAADRPQVQVAMRSDGAQVELVVRDNGVGLPAGIEVETSPSLGLNLVSLLARQLQGTLQVRREGGTAFTLTFPL
jgi:two-component sensor histidine kinase